MHIKGDKSPWRRHFRWYIIFFLIPKWTFDMFYLVHMWQTTPTDPPVEVTRGTILAPVSVFERPNKNKFISMKQNSYLNHFQRLLFHNFPPPLNQYNLFWPYKNGRQKLLLRCQNWVTSTGGCRNLVPGWHSQSRVGGRRGLSCIVYFSLIIKNKTVILVFVGTFGTHWIKF